MNERINELFGQALDQAVPETWTTLNPAQLSKLKDKFAELIVKECANVLDKAQWDKGEDWVCADGTRIIPQIKEHFGVEQ